MWWTILCVAWANPVDAWGPGIDAGVLGVNPNVNTSFEGAAEGQFIVGHGLGKGVDVNLALAGEAPTLQPAAQELLARWFPTENIGMVAHLAYTPSEPGLALGPELHTTWPIERAALYADVGWAPQLLSEGSSVGAGTVVAGGEVPLHRHLWLFLETNHRYEADGAVVLVTPGLYATLNEAGDSELCLGVRLPAAGGPEAGSVGLWFNRNVGLW